MVCLAQRTLPWCARFKDELLASFNASLDDEGYEVLYSALGRIGAVKDPLSSVQGSGELAEYLLKVRKGSPESRQCLTRSIFLVLFRKVCWPGT